VPLSCGYRVDREKTKMNCGRPCVTLSEAVKIFSPSKRAHLRVTRKRKVGRETYIARCLARRARGAGRPGTGRSGWRGQASPPSHTWRGLLHSAAAAAFTTTPRGKREQDVSAIIDLALKAGSRELAHHVGDRWMRTASTGPTDSCPASSSPRSPGHPSGTRSASSTVPRRTIGVRSPGPARTRRGTPPASRCAAAHCR